MLFDSESKIFYPPRNDKLIQSEIDNSFCLYENLFAKFSSDDILINIIKRDRSVIKYSKNKLDKLSKSLAGKIKKVVGNKDKQIKVFAITSASEESILIMSASAFLGAHHSICFEELSNDAIKTRIDMFKPDLILFRENLKRKMENIKIEMELKKINSFLVDVNEIEKNFEENIIFLDKFANPREYKQNDFLFTLYTSGSTGKPKAIMHSAKNYFEYSEFSSRYFFGLDSNSKIFTATDAGWINGHTYAIYGPLACGAQTIICEDLKIISDPKNLIQIINEIKITCLYMSVTFLRLLKSNHTKKTKEIIFTIDRIGSCGEPLAHEVGEWALRFFKPKRKSIVNTYFQTETGGILVAPRDEDGPPDDLSSVGKPREELGLFIAKDKFTEKEIEENNLNKDEILIKNRWKGLFQCVLSDRKVDYFTSNGFFRLHDVGFFDKKGYLYIGGRSDDVINTSGHRISSSEIESICLYVDGVKESCVVGIPDTTIGEKPVLFISLNDEFIGKFEEVKTDLLSIITSKLSAYHQPETIYFFQNLPKTRSGKIIRRMMRDLLIKLFIDNSKDYSTLHNLSEFRISENIFIQHVIKKNCKSGKNFKLNQLANNCNIKLGSEELLINLLIRIYELINWYEGNLEIKTIAIYIFNDKNEIIKFQKSLDKSFCLKKIFSIINESDLKKESCILDIKLASFIFEFEKNNILNISIDNYDLINGYSLKVTQFKNDYNNTILKEKIEEIFIGNYVDKEEKYLSEIDRINKSKMIICDKCKISNKEMNNNRNQGFFFIPALNSNGENIYICDLCLNGL